MSESKSVQTSFNTPIKRSKEVLERLGEQYEFDHITLAVSGGTDSIVAADVFARFGPGFGLEPDSVTHINTGAAVPQSRLVAKTIAEVHDLEYVEQGYRNRRNSLACRVLEKGWPGQYTGPVTGLGHSREWANRKNKPMDAVYANTDGEQLWVSGARKLESKKRSGNVSDSGIDSDKPRRVWGQPIVGWTSAEKQRYIKERGLPVSEAYLVLGFSGECTACAFDNAGLLTDLDLLSPELSYCIRTLALWLYQRVKRGDVELAPKRLMWGWDVEEQGPKRMEEIQADYHTFEAELKDDGKVNGLQERPAEYEVNMVSQNMVGCSEENCKTMDERPTWILNLSESQIVDRDDVKSHWETGETPSRFPV